MAAITIGVPVFNGDALLDEALQTLASQTFTDFVVLIFDNASTDGTATIAQDWVRRDPRFRYHRNAENIGGVRNFLAPLMMADTPWFLWRAYDDLSDLNYLEVLHTLATAAPGCRLAASTIVTQDLDGGRRREHLPPPPGRPGNIVDILRTLQQSHPSWFYGLWDRRTLVDIWSGLAERFPYAFASDHLTIYGPIIEGAVRTTRDTAFIQRFNRTAATPRGGTRMPYAVMAEVRSAFRRELSRIRATSDLPPSRKLALRVSEPVYLQHVLPSLLKMARTRLREGLGIAKPALASRHVTPDA